LKRKWIGGEQESEENENITGTEENDNITESEDPEPIKKKKED